MAIVNTLLVTEPINTFTANAARAATAAGREAVLSTGGALVHGLASALATLDEKICLTNTYVPRARREHDPRWTAVSGRLNDASQTSSALAERLRSASRNARTVVAAGEDVEYTGSLTDQHGRFTLAGRCSCDNPDCKGFELRHGLQNAVLICVNACSFAPAPGQPWPAATGATNAGYRLDNDPRDLPEGLPVQDAIAIVRGMSAITSRIRAVLLTWRDTFTEPFTRPCLADTSGYRHPHILARHILEAFDHVRPDLTSTRTSLRSATSVLAEIEATRAGRQVA